MTEHETPARRGLFAGRFQPFHMGHMDVVEHLTDIFQEIVIGLANPDPLHLLNTVTSSHPNFSRSRNPFSYALRYDLIQAAIANQYSDYSKFRILPLFPPDLYGEKVFENFAGHKSEVCYCIPSNDKKEIHLQKLYREMGFEVYEVPVKRSNISASTIRERMRSNDQSWRTLVPAAVSKILTNELLTSISL